MVCFFQRGAAINSFNRFPLALSVWKLAFAVDSITSLALSLWKLDLCVFFLMTHATRRIELFPFSIERMEAAWHFITSLCTH